MGLTVVLAYIALNLLSPAEMLPALGPYRPMLILAGVGLVAALMDRMRTPEVGKLRVQAALVLMFFGYTCAAGFPHGWLGANLSTLLNLAPSVIVYFLGIVQLRSPSRLRFTRTTLVAVGLFILCNAMLEAPVARATAVPQPYVLVNNQYSAEGLLAGTDIRIRGLGTLQDPNDYAQFLLLILPLLYVAKRDSGLGVGWFGAISVTVLFLVGIYYSGSRGAVVGLVLMVGLFLTRRFKTTGTILATGFGSVVLLLMQAYRGRGVSYSSGMDRLAIWSDGMNYFKYNPIFGVGPFHFVNLQGMTAHNSYLLVAAELGIIGFFLWLGVIVVTWIQLSRIPKLVGATNPELARWAVGLRLSLGAYLFTCFFLSRAYDLPLFMLLGMCGGVIIAAGGDDAIPLRGTSWPAWTLALNLGILLMIYVMLRLRAV